MLPRMRYRDKISNRTSVEFAGYNHTRGAGDGDLWDMANLTSDDYPVMSPRKPRKHFSGIHPTYIWDNGGLWYTADDTVTKIYFKGTEKASFGSLVTIKDVACMGFYTAILTDNGLYIYDNDQTIKPAGASLIGLSIAVKNGTYAEEEAELNTIEYKGSDEDFSFSDSFRPGDALTIDAGVNSGSYIVREVTADTLVFYENTFKEAVTVQSASISRDVPDLDFICSNENRLWGCRGDVIYGSKMGDPFNFNVFDGLATDSWATQAGTGGEFTGCISYLGYPVFFKEENIYKVYGDIASNFRLMGSANLGVKKGSGRTLAIAGETLFYLSRAGVMAYAGGMPSSISLPFGDEVFKNGAAGSDGLKYYISMEGGYGHELFVFDTRRKLWHREDNSNAVCFAFDHGLYMLREETNGGVTTKELYLTGEADWGTTTEETVYSMAQFADFTDKSSTKSAYKKGVSKFLIRAELEPNAKLTVKVRYDHRTDWQTIKELSTLGEQADDLKKWSYYIPIIPQRADQFSLRIEGIGMWHLYSLTRELYNGSAMH